MRGMIKGTRGLTSIPDEGDETTNSRKYVQAHKR